MTVTLLSSSPRDRLLKTATGIADSCPCCRGTDRDGDTREVAAKWSAEEVADCVTKFRQVCTSLPPTRRLLRPPGVLHRSHCTVPGQPPGALRPLHLSSCFCVGSGWRAAADSLWCVFLRSGTSS